MHKCILASRTRLSDQIHMLIIKKHYMYSLSTESSAKEVFIFWTREQGGGGRGSEKERMREHDSNLARLEAMSELNKNS